MLAASAADLGSDEVLHAVAKRADSIVVEGAIAPTVNLTGWIQRGADVDASDGAFTCGSKTTMRAERQCSSAIFVALRPRNQDHEYALAPLGRRIAAGGFDLAVVVVVTAAILLLHLKTSGTLFPVWVATVVVMASMVLPHWIWGSTLGLQSFGLKLVRVDGRPMDILEIAFRDLVGRGLVAVATLVVALMVPAMAAYGARESPMPPGLASIVVILAGINMVLVILGQGLACFRRDRRTASDLAAKVIAVDAEDRCCNAPSLLNPPRVSSSDEAADWRGAERRKRLRLFVISQLACVILGMALPMVVRVPFQVAEPDVQAKPTMPEELEAVHYEMVRRDLEEERLRHELSVRPGWSSLDRLVEYLQEHGRDEAARAAFAAFVEAADDAYGYQAFGVWLYQERRYRAALNMLERAMVKGADDDITHAYIGLTFERLSRGNEVSTALDIRRSVP